jgi:DNA invertase Pin-like site-specific DNA recombinase
MPALRAVIWCAVSTKAQIDDDKDSLPNQENDARAVCERFGWQIVDVLKVPGHSRRYVDIHDCARDMAAQGINAFNRLIELWTTHGFDVLVCRDGDRFARTQTLHSYVVESTIDIGARIYSLSDGWIDDKNYRMWIAMSGYKSASSVDFLVNSHRVAMDSAAKRGMPTGPITLLSHKIIRNEVGRRVGIEVDESKRRLFDDLATLLLEGVAWAKIDRLMYERFGHVNPKTGRPYGSRTMYKMINNPYFWGNSGRHYDGFYGLWAFDPNEPAPEGVEIYYGTHQSVYTGDLANRIMAELRRRTELRGTANPEVTHRFTGLLICATCRCSLGYYRQINPRQDGSHYTGWMCYTRWSNSLTRPKCDQGKVISDPKVIDYFSGLLEQIMAAKSTDAVFNDSNSDMSKAQQLKQLRQETAELEKSIGEMIVQQSRAPQNVQAIYSKQILEASERLEILRRNMAELKKFTESPSIMVARQQAITDLIDMGVEAFWEQSPSRINQTLHRLMGKRRLIVDQKVIIGIGTAPKWR